MWRWVELKLTWKWCLTGKSDEDFCTFEAQTVVCLPTLHVGSSKTLSTHNSHSFPLFGLGADFVTDLYALWCFPSTARVFALALRLTLWVMSFFSEGCGWLDLRKSTLLVKYWCCNASFSFHTVMMSFTYSSFDQWLCRSSYLCWFGMMSPAPPTPTPNSTQPMYCW